MAVAALLAAGQVSLRAALRGLGGAGLLDLLRATILTRAGLAALACTAVAVLLWLRVLSRAELGHVYPLLSLTYVFAPGLAAVVLEERVEPLGWVGLVLVCAGVALVTLRR